MSRQKSLPIRMAGLAAVAVLGLAACGSDAGEAGQDADVTVTMTDPDGAEVGTVGLTETDDGTRVEARLEGLPPGGFHGFHVHETGLCEADSPDPSDPSSTGDFLSAGGHLAAEGESHADHVGDMPSLLVADDGVATLSVVTDRFTLDDLTADDGTAVMVHADPDNSGNIPERYAPDGADEDTLGTGDSGDRVACGVVEAG